MNSDIYLFNPTCEMAVANGTFSYMPPRNLQKFEIDLGVIPSYFARENDFVVVREPVDANWISYMKELGFKIPNYILRDEISSNKDLLNSELGYLRPWGWSPVVHNLFKGLKPFCSEDYKNTPNSNWKEGHRDIYSRITALEVYNHIASSHNFNYLAGSEEAPVVCRNIGDVEKQLDRLGRLVVKAPWSCSGRGLLVIRGNKLTTPETQWINGILKSQKYIMAEEWREKLFDISFHYFIDEESKVNHIGNASFITDEKGAYMGNNLQAIPLTLDQKIKDFLDAEKINNLVEILKNAIELSPLAKCYYGYLGVDAYVFNTAKGLKIFPCVEINLRYNMGTLNLKIRDFVHPKAEGIIMTDRIIDSSVPQFVAKMKDKYPLEYKNGRLIKGFIPLVPVNENNVFINYLLLE